MRACGRNAKIGAVIHGIIGTCYLCFTCTRVFTLSWVKSGRWADERSASDGKNIFILVLHGAQVTHKFCRSIVVYYFSTFISHLDIYGDRAMFSDF